jgi:hypothetical protein
LQCRQTKEAESESEEELDRCIAMQAPKEVERENEEELDSRIAMQAHQRGRK